MFFITTYLFKLEAIGWYYWHAYKQKNESPSLNLQDYKVEIDALPIPGLENASGFTYDRDKNTLFTVLNQAPYIIELDLKGNILRKIHVLGVDDMEGITHVKDNRYVIADERENRLMLITLDAGVTEIDTTSAPKMKLSLNPAGNKNFEGVSWDDINNRLLVVKERDPKYVLSVSGFFEADIGKPLNIEIKKIDAFEKAFEWSLRDLSSLTFLNKTGHLLLLSDESRLIKEYDGQGNALGALALWKGFHGLKKHVPQAEGITTDSEDNIYIMSEPNLFYKFKSGSQSF